MVDRGSWGWQWHDAEWWWWLESSDGARCASVPLLLREWSNSYFVIALFSLERDGTQQASKYNKQDIQCRWMLNGIVSRLHDGACPLSRALQILSGSYILLSWSFCCTNNNQSRPSTYNTYHTEGYFLFWSPVKSGPSYFVIVGSLWMESTYISYLLVMSCFWKRRNAKRNKQRGACCFRKTPSNR